MVRFKAGLKYLFVVLLVLSLGFPLAGAKAQSDQAGMSRSTDPGIRVLKSDLDGVLIEIVPPQPRLDSASEGAAPNGGLSVPGYGLSDLPGAPQLPLKGFFVGVPPYAEVQLRVLELTEEVLPERLRVPPAPTWVLEYPPPDEWASSLATNAFARTLSTEENPAIYGVDAYYPAAPVRIVEEGKIRHQGVAQLEFYPLRTNPVTGELLFHARVLVELQFDYPGGRPDAASIARIQEPDSYEGLLQRSLINYDSAAGWRSQPQAQQATAAQSTRSLDPGYKVFVSRTGMYKLDYSDLQNAGLPVDTLDPGTFQMFHHDREIAIHVEGEGDGTFGAGDYVLFYGEAVDYPYDKYTTENVYWLTYGQANGRRMDERDGTPAGGMVPASFREVMHYELDREYWNLMPDPGHDDHFSRWYWNYIFAPGNFTHDVVLTDVLSTTVSPTIRIQVYGRADFPPTPDHRMAVYVNENWVGLFEWEGITRYVAEYDFSPSYLQQMTNTIRLEALLAPGTSYDFPTLDWFEIEYSRDFMADADALAFSSPQTGTVEFNVDGFMTSTVEILDVTTPLSVTRIISTVVEPSASGHMLRFGNAADEPGQYWSESPAQWLSPDTIALDMPSDLRSVENGADYLMITHRDFYTDVLPLADYYSTTQDLRVMVVDVQQVYDEFSGGVVYPAAIRDFLAYAFENWVAPAPTYVLLVGDGHFDYKFLSPATNLDWYLPPYLAYEDPWMGETATENRYVSISGDDAWPDMIIGRFPVNSSAQAQVMVNKSLSYQQAPPAGDWNQRLLFVTDNPDDAGNFHTYSDEIADNYVPAPYTSTKVYFGLAPYTAPAAAKAAILAGISEGRLFVSYIGHAAIPNWAGEQILHVNDVASLTNDDRLPVMLPMTCLEGYFHYKDTGFRSLSENLVRAPNGGAVASWAPTGLGVAEGHDLLEKGLLKAVFYDGVRRLGDATLEGKRYLWDRGGGGHRELVETYVLLGDPALQLHVLDADLQLEKTVEPAGAVMPGQVLTYTLTFTNAGPATAHQVVLTDVVPSLLVSPTVVYASPEVISQPAGIEFTWLITDLLPHTGGEIQFTAMVSPTTGPATIVNEAELASAEPEIDPANNVVSVTTEVQFPDLYVSKTGTDLVEYGQFLTYTISWGNAGLVAAPSARLTDTLPIGVNYQSDNSGWPHAEPSPGVIVWEITPDPLGPGAGGSFVVTAQVTTGQSLPVFLVNKVQIDADIRDGDLSDNQDQWSTTLLGGKYFVYLPVVVKPSP